MKLFLRTKYHTSEFQRNLADECALGKSSSTCCRFNPPAVQPKNFEGGYWAALFVLIGCSEKGLGLLGADFLALKDHIANDEEDDRGGDHSHHLRPRN